MNASPSVAPPGSTISDLENEIIAFFVDLVRSFGAPKSLGAIYGLLFVSEAPICFEQIATRLCMSNGSVSQGLRILKDFGAVRVTFKPGERRDFFIAETQIRQLVCGFLRQNVERQLGNGESRLGNLSAQAATVDGTAALSRLQERLEILRRWQIQARSALPFVLKMLEGE